MGPYRSGVVKREIGGQWTGCKRIQTLAKFVFNPFYESFKILMSLINMCCFCKNRSDNLLEVKKNPRVKCRYCGDVMQVVRAQEVYDDMPHHPKDCHICRKMVGPDQIIRHCEKDEYDLCVPCAQQKFINDAH